MNDKMFEELLQSVEEMDQISKGNKKSSREFILNQPMVRAIREQTGLSQTHFARLIGVSKRTLENWEQGRRIPTGPARALLKIVQSNPQDAIKALHK